MRHKNTDEGVATGPVDEDGLRLVVGTVPCFRAVVFVGVLNKRIVIQSVAKDLGNTHVYVHEILRT